MGSCCDRLVGQVIICGCCRMHLPCCTGCADLATCWPEAAATHSQLSHCSAGLTPPLCAAGGCIVPWCSTPGALPPTKPPGRRASEPLCALCSWQRTPAARTVAILLALPKRARVWRQAPPLCARRPHSAHCLQAECWPCWRRQPTRCPPGARGGLHDAIWRHVGLLCCPCGSSMGAPLVE